MIASHPAFTFVSGSHSLRREGGEKRWMTGSLSRNPFCHVPRHGFRSAGATRSRVWMCSDKSDDEARTDSTDSNSNEPGGEDSAITHVTLEMGREMMDHAIDLAKGDTRHVAKECAIGVVKAFLECYPSDQYTRIFIVVGDGMNGLIGLFIAELLKQSGQQYEPFVYTSTNNNKYVSEDKIKTFCEEREIEMFDFVPSTLNFYFDIIVDALLGIGFDGGDIHQKYWNVFDMLVSTDLPLLSVDVPSGWDLTLGPRQIDLTADTFVKPDVLVSIGIPKLCAKKFAGDFHFIASPQLVPKDWFEQRRISLPRFSPGSNCILFESNARPFEKRSGEIYTKPGTFNATLFTKNPRRKWVDPDEDDELWDELD